MTDLKAWEEFLETDFPGHGRDFFFLLLLNHSVGVFCLFVFLFCFFKYLYLFEGSEDQKEDLCFSKLLYVLFPLP